jgi:5-methylcytosine-specific restriction endonuclease McrA
MRTYRNDRTYRRNRALMLSQNDICGICGHAGAMTADHIIPPEMWLQLYGSLDGVHDLANLQPAHGILNSPLRYNYCPQCRQLCNQAKGSRLTDVSPRSRAW